jgi:hypothetical protein
MKMRSILVSGLVIVAVVAVSAYVTWAILAAARLGEGWAGLDTAWPYLLAGVTMAGLAIAGFLRLAFFSQSHGYDDRVDMDQR